MKLSDLPEKKSSFDLWSKDHRRCSEYISIFLECTAWYPLVRAYLLVSQRSSRLKKKKEKKAARKPPRPTCVYRHIGCVHSRRALTTIRRSRRYNLTWLSLTTVSSIIHRRCARCTEVGIINFIELARDALPRDMQQASVSQPPLPGKRAGASGFDDDARQRAVPEQSERYKTLHLQRITL